MALTAEKVRELLDYDPETGVFTWRVAKGRKIKIGSITGTLNDCGYILIGVDYRRYYAHRLALLIVNGKWPTNQVDHINGVRNDNRLANLREATHMTNCENKHCPSVNNKSGFLGVSWHSQSGGFRSTIVTKGKQTFLGLFADPADAHDAYLAAKRRLHPGSTI